MTRIHGLLLVVVTFSQSACSKHEAPSSESPAAQGGLGNRGAVAEVMAAASAVKRLAASTATTGAATPRYEIEQGIVSYRQVGMQTGTEVLYFKKFGDLEAREANFKFSLPQLPSVPGVVAAAKTHTMTLVDGDTTTNWDVATKQGTRLLGTFDAFGGKQNLQALAGMSRFSVAMIRSMAGKQSGQRTLLDLTCEVWTLPKLGGEVCVHKGLALELSVTLLGMKQHSVATEVKLNVSPPAEKFVVPTDITLTERSAKDLFNFDGPAGKVDPEMVKRLIQVRDQAQTP
ncbi:MAG: hypothetical protein RJA70_521 [Pseudomonadota bacterium]|jgi:hypothetical protein